MAVTEDLPIRLAILCAVLAAVLAGCQMVETSEAEDTGQVLAAAGFQMKVATTPEQMANLEKLAQRKLVIQEQNGQSRYVYADAQDCKCVYVGSERNYDEYQRLSVQEQIAEDNADAPLDWNGWGPWGPWEP